MRIIKPLRLGLLTRPYTYQRQHHLGITVMAMASLDSVPKLETESTLWKTAQTVLAEDETLDLGIPKPCAEFLVSGSAWAPMNEQGARAGQCAVAAALGAHEKALIVHGTRHWMDGRPGTATPVDGIALDWRHTYGHARLADNPQGMGEAPSADGRRPLPHIEAPGHRIERPGQVGVPAGFGPVSPIRPARFALAGSYDPGYLDDGLLGLPDTLDPRFFNTASPDQWLAQPELAPCMPYRLHHMHPSRALIAGTLPDWRARAFLRHATTPVLEEVRLRLTTAWFFPDRERVLLMYQGAAPIEQNDGTDVDLIMPALERGDAPRGLDHYVRVLAQRLPRETGGLYALRDQDLVPPEALGADADGCGLPVRPQVVNQRNRAVHLKADMRERIKAAGHATVDYDLDGPTLPALNSLDDLPDYLRTMRRQTRRAKADMLRRRREGEAKMDAAASVSPQASGHLATARAAIDTPAPGGPPRVNRSDQAIAMLDLARAAQAREAPTALTPDATQAMLDDAQRRLGELYRHSAHLQAPAAPALPGRSRRLRRRVEALLAGSRDLSGLDLTGVDLSGLDLSNTRCRATWMEGANLTNTRFSDADLQDAVLTRATAVGTDFSGARLVGTNLGSLHAEDATFVAALLADAVADEARFVRCDFSRATCRDCVIGTAVFDAVRWHDATLERVTFWRDTVLRASTFLQATLARCVWIDCAFDAVSFERATLSACVWMQSGFATPCQLRGARLTTCAVVLSEMTDADFSDATLKACNLRGVALNGADFTHSRLWNCDLSQAVLRDASFVRADASESLFMGADLQGANLRDCDLMDSLLQKSELRFADLRGANIFRADLSETLMDDSTRSTGAYARHAKTLPRAASAPKAQA